MNFDEQVKIMELREKLGQKTRYNEVEVKLDQRVNCENSFSRKNGLDHFTMERCKYFV